MEIHLIVAVAEKNLAIGKDNGLLWHLPADMKYFKETTSGFPIITGRKNYESIPVKFRPLPNRENIVISRNLAYPSDGCFVVSSLEEAVKKAAAFGKDKCFIIGGGQIYAEAVQKKLLDVLHITWVKGEFAADTFFPDIHSDLNKNWTKTEVFHHSMDDKNKFEFTIVKYTPKFAS